MIRKRITEAGATVFRDSALRHGRGWRSHAAGSCDLSGDHVISAGRKYRVKEQPEAPVLMDFLQLGGDLNLGERQSRTQILVIAAVFPWCGSVSYTTLL